MGNARGEACPASCVADAEELAWRKWPKTLNADCARMQRSWGVCTNKNDPNHAEVMQNCPATCANARGECQSSCVPDATELSRRWWPDTLNADCARMDLEWGVCTNPDDPNHAEVMRKCTATCANARGEACPASCVADAEELAWRKWPNTLNADCARMQRSWGVCTNKNDPNHAEVMRKCPATCANARGEACPASRLGVSRRSVVAHHTLDYAGMKRILMERRLPLD